MARIMKSTLRKSTIEQIFNLYLCSVTSEGFKDKIITTYKQHFHAISKRLDVSIPIADIKSKHLGTMIQRRKDENLSPRSINSYTRTLKAFFSWCNQEGYTQLNITIYKAPEAVKKIYTDAGLLTLLEKPKPTVDYKEGIGFEPMPIFIVCHGSFKQIQQISVPLGFHFIVGNEPQGCTVDTVSDSIWGFRLIFKDMPQVRIACPASHLYTLHSMTVILNLHNGGFFDGLCESRPAAAALIFIR